MFWGGGGADDTDGSFINFDLNQKYEREQQQNSCNIGLALGFSISK